MIKLTWTSFSIASLNLIQMRTSRSKDVFFLSFFNVYNFRTRYNEFSQSIKKQLVFCNCKKNSLVIISKFPLYIRLEVISIKLIINQEAIYLINYVRTQVLFRYDLCTTSEEEYYYVKQFCKWMSFFSIQCLP